MAWTQCQEDSQLLHKYDKGMRVIWSITVDVTTLVTCLTIVMSSASYVHHGNSSQVTCDIPEDYSCDIPEDY